MSYGGVRHVEAESRRCKGFTMIKLTPPVHHTTHSLEPMFWDSYVKSQYREKIRTLEAFELEEMGLLK